MNYWINFIVNILPISSITAILFGVINYLMTRGEMVKMYFDDHDSETLRKARKEVYEYKYKNKESLLNQNSFAVVCNHYHRYGLLLKHHRIPKWVFDSSNRLAIIKCYEKSLEYIKLRRKDNEYYAEYFEWLYNKIK